MKITVFGSFAELPRYCREWARFPTVRNFFLSLDWFEILSEYGLQKDYQPRIYVVCDDQGTPLGALYCCSTGPGGKLASLTSFYTVEYGPVICATEAQPILRALMAFIVAERPRWHSIDLRFLRAESMVLPTLLAVLREHNFAPYRFFQYRNWFAPVAGVAFNEYFGARPSQLRNTVRRRSKKAEQEYQVEIRILSEPGAQLENAISGYTRVYNSSWKHVEPFPEFMPALIRRCATLGILRLGELRLDGESVAAQVWISTPERAVIYKLAYDEKFKHLSAGSVLSARLFEQALDVDHILELDYGVGDEAYKRDWMTEVRMIEGVVAFNLRTAAGLVRAIAELGRRLWRSIRRKILDRPSERHADLVLRNET